MRYVDRTFPTPEHNLACDEALLELCEAGGAPVLRVWEPAAPFVVLGYASPSAADVDLAACRARRIPVLRRISGGGTVVQGPGVLNFSVVLPLSAARELRTIAGTTRYVLHRHRDALQPLLSQPVALEGSSDLTVAGRKFAGHAQRRRGQHVLFHGSLLLAADLRLIGQLLPLPGRQPAYRDGRSHADFLANLRLPADTVKAALQHAWGATEHAVRLPDDRIDALVAQHYALDAWNYRF